MLLPFINNPNPFSSLLPVVVTLPCFILSVTLSPVIVAGPDQSVSTIKWASPSCLIVAVKFAPLWVMQTLHPFSLSAFKAAVRIVDWPEVIETD